MKRGFLTLVLLCLAWTVSAQKYVVAPLFADSVKVHAVTGRDSTWKNTDPYIDRMIAKGEVIDAVGHEKDHRYIVFKKDGKKWEIHSEYLEFSPENPEGIVNPLPEDAQLKHSVWGYYFASSAFLYTILALIGISFLIAILYARFLFLKPIAILFIPVALLLTAGLEIGAWYVLGSDDVIWWCNPDRHGFFGALWRLIPFVLVGLAQAASIYAFETLLVSHAKVEKPEDFGLALKPAFIGFGLFFPLLIGLVIIFAICGFRGQAAEITTALISFSALLYGAIRAFYKNAKQLGFFLGLIATLFSFIYIIGILVLGWLFIVIVFKLILQLLTVLAMVVAVFGAFSILGSGGSGGGGGGGGGGGLQHGFRSDGGVVYTSRSDAERASSNPNNVRQV